MSRSTLNRIFFAVRWKIGLLALQATPLLANELLDIKITQIKTFTQDFTSFAIEQQEQHPEFFYKLQSTLEKGSIERVEEGDGGAYLIKNREGPPLFIVKPTDEGINCLNCPKQNHPPLPERPAREHIPLYQSALREAFCYELATVCQIENITPKTYLTILSLPQFFLFSPNGSFEKLCSIAEYIPNSLPLRSLLQMLFSLHLKDEDLSPYFSEEDFDLVNLFIWLTYDTDAHAGNILAYPKKVDANGFTIYGLKKIDNSLSFPEKNVNFFHFLMHFPLARRDLSILTKEKISNLPIKALKKSFEKFHLTPALPAFEERVFVIQELAKRPSISYYEVSLRLLLLEKDEGLSLALSFCSLEELEKFLPSLF